MDVKQRMTDVVRALPVAHRVVVVVALAVLGLLAAFFVRWVTTPSYSVLYSGLDDGTVATAVQELDSLGVPYKLEGGGSRILVPREQLYQTRAALASEGVSGQTSPPGYELLDEQGLTVSDFRQRVDYQRALEGELSKTLMAMQSVDSATVRLVLPEEELFTEQQEKVTASVLLDARREMSAEEIETVTFLVSSGVEGLEPKNVTVADVDGTVLNAPEDAVGSSATTDRHRRQTAAFEQELAVDVKDLLDRMTGGTRSSVVVRADLDFDEQSVERETFDRESSVPLKEQNLAETYQGTGVPPDGGAVGVDGGPLALPGSESNYERSETVTEYGVDREVVKSVNAPGDVEKLSVAIVVDNGDMTGAEVPPNGEIEQLVTAALGLDAQRGDTVAVQKVAFPVQEDEEAAVPADGGLASLVPEIVGGVVLLAIALGLLLMTRRRDEEELEPIELPEVESMSLPAGHVEDEIAEPEPTPALDAREALQGSVTKLVEQQPEEIAVLLRSWLADRR